MDLRMPMSVDQQVHSTSTGCIQKVWGQTCSAPSQNSVIHPVVMSIVFFLNKYSLRWEEAKVNEWHERLWIQGNCQGDWQKVSCELDRFLWDVEWWWQCDQCCHNIIEISLDLLICMVSGWSGEYPRVGLIRSDRMQWMGCATLAGSVPPE